MAKTLSIEEYNEARGRRSQVGSICASVLRSFVASGDEVWELENEDIKRPDGWLQKKNENQGYQNCSYIKKVLVQQTNVLNLEEYIEVNHIKGHVYLARKELL